MRCEVGLIIEWGICHENGITIESVDDVLAYVESVVGGNALFDNLDLSVKVAAVKELDDE